MRYLRDPDEESRGGVSGEEVQSAAKSADRDLSLNDPDRRRPEQSIIPSPSAPPKLGISDAALEDAAKELGVDVAMINAFVKVETLEDVGFDNTGRPVLLFERHKFREFTGERYDKDPQYNDISNPVMGGYGLANAQWGRMERAAMLDREAALKATSWGRFQLLGANYKEAGYDSLDAFVLAMQTSEEAQLKAFVSFIKSDKVLWNAMRAKDWATMARRYNGPSYRVNKYDSKLKSAYEDELRKAKPSHSPKPKGDKPSRP